MISLQMISCDNTDIIQIGNRIMTALKNYIKEVLGIDIEIKAISNTVLRTLPMAMAGLYDYAQARLIERDIVLVTPKEGFTIDRLKKHFEILEQAFEKPCVALIESMEAFTRARMIEKKIQFIIPGKQMYLPAFMLDLKEYGSKPKTLPTAMQPSAQFLLLFHLQKESLERINFKDIADKLLYNGMTITRAAYYLHNVGLCKIEGTKDKFLHFDLPKKELWERAEPLMSSPVKQFKYYSGSVFPEIFKSFMYSNISALSHYSNINPDPVDYYAARASYIETAMGPNLKYSGQLEGNICIEEWKYDPSMLSIDGNVDPLSLYLCFREDKNERIEMALEQLIESVKW